MPGRCQGGRDARSWDLCRRQGKKFSHRNIEYRPRQNLFTNFSFSFPGIPSLVAVLELAASVHGCDLKHPGWLQLENPANLLLDTASPLTVPTISRPASNSFLDDYILSKAPI